MTRGIDFRACIPASIGPFRILALVALLAFGTADRLRADPAPSDWFDMVKVCERVMLEKSIRAFNDFAPAPFSMGTPFLKEYAIYNGPQNLVAIARLEKRVWTNCTVREPTENDPSYRKRHGRIWEAGFSAAFYGPDYRVTRPRVAHPSELSSVIRCKDGAFAYFILPSPTDMYNFRVELIGVAQSNWASFCDNPGN